jgi:hypothetical protein
MDEIVVGTEVGGEAAVIAQELPDAPEMLCANGSRLRSSPFGDAHEAALHVVVTADTPIARAVFQAPAPTAKSPQALYL